MGDRAGAGNFRGIVHCVCAETFYNPASFCERMAVFCRDGMASFKSRIPDGIIGQLAMQAAVNRIGTSAIAGYTAANKVDQLSVLVDNAVGIGIANYVAQNYGAGKMDRIKKGVWHCFLMLTAMNFAMGALLLLGQSFVVPMFVTNPTAEIMQYSKDYLFTVVPFYFFLGALLVYRTAIQSVGNTWAPFAACVIELAARILCASVLSVPFGYRAVCFATPFAWLTALSLLIPVYIVLIRKLDGGQST